MISTRKLYHKTAFSSAYNFDLFQPGSKTHIIKRSKNKSATTEKLCSLLGVFSI